MKVNCIVVSYRALPILKFLGKFRLNLPHGGKGGITYAGGSFAGMGAISHQPEISFGGAVGETEGAKGTDSLPNSPDHTGIAAGKVGEGAGGWRLRCEGDVRGRG